MKEYLSKKDLFDLVPDLLISFLVFTYFDEWDYFLYAFLGLQIVNLLVWLKWSIWNWFKFFVFKRSDELSFYVLHLKDMGYPLYRYPLEANVSENVEDYLLRIVEEDDFDMDLRLDACGFLESYRTLKESGFFQKAMEFEHLFEMAAIQRNNPN